MLQSATKTETQIENKSLDWRDRPPKVKEKIHHIWEELVHQYIPNKWLFNGESGAYYLCGIQEYALIKTLIKNNPDRKEFFVLDVGAGEFQFGRKLAEFLNDDAEIPQDVIVHIMGIRAEPHMRPETKTDGICKLYEFGRFKVEELYDEFLTRGLDLKNKIDVAVTNYCLIHLVDPVGTFLQIYNDLLRPKTGFLLMDGFHYSLVGEEGSDLTGANMLYLLQSMKAPLLYMEKDIGHCFAHFILQRSDKNFELPLSYGGVKPIGYTGAIYSYCLTQFHDLKVTKLNIVTNSEKSGLYGDKDLYAFLKQNHLFIEPPVETPLVVHRLWKTKSYVGPMFIDDSQVECSMQIAASSMEPMLTTMYSDVTQKNRKRKRSEIEDPKRHDDREGIYQTGSYELRVRKR